MTGCFPSLLGFLTPLRLSLGACSMCLLLRQLPFDILLLGTPKKVLSTYTYILRAFTNAHLICKCKDGTQLPECSRVVHFTADKNN